MRMLNVIVEQDPDTGLFVGSVQGWPGPGAHSQDAAFDELEMNLREVIGMLLEDGIEVLLQRNSQRQGVGPQI